ncbi:transposase [Sulfobacillus acidophilus TPY]|nr:transposase [Sulfobacillus acidophilus TPY]
MQWHLRVRRFVCTNPACSQAIFCERLPGVAPYQRWTRQAQQAMVCWTLVTSASDAARQLQTTGFPVSRQTLNRWILAMPLPDPPAPRVIGLDEWARRKGQRYATIVVDHERGTILDILPDTRAETVAAWLRAHPTVAIVTRDRAVAFAHAIAEGVPQAQPVADRFHLFRNLADAVERFFQRHPEPLPPSEPLAAPEAPTETPNPSRSQARWAAIHARLAQGDNLSAIARALNLDRHTVRKYARMPACWR